MESSYPPMGLTSEQLTTAAMIAANEPRGTRFDFLPDRAGIRLYVVTENHTGKRWTITQDGTTLPVVKGRLPRR